MAKLVCLLFACVSTSTGTKVFSANVTSTREDNLFMRASFDFEEYNSEYFTLSRRAVSPEGSLLAVSLLFVLCSSLNLFLLQHMLSSITVHPYW